MSENFEIDPMEVLSWIRLKLLLPPSAKDFDLAELTPQDWETIVSRCYDGWEWRNLLQLKPEFADKCPWNKLEYGDWVYLLSGRSSTRTAGRSSSRW